MNVRVDWIEENQQESKLWVKSRPSLDLYDTRLVIGLPERFMSSFLSKTWRTCHRSGGSQMKILIEISRIRVSVSALFLSHLCWNFCVISSISCISWYIYGHLLKLTTLRLLCLHQELDFPAKDQLYISVKRISYLSYLYAFKNNLFDKIVILYTMSVNINTFCFLLHAEIKF